MSSLSKFRSDACSKRMLPVSAVQSVALLLSRRNAAGQSIVFMVVIIALLIICPIGLFSFEVNRAESCRQQLRAACESAALAAAATLASQDNLDPIEGHTQAMQTALTSFQQNSCLGISLADAAIGGSDDIPESEKSSLFIEFLDPNNNNQPVSVGDPDGKIVRVTAAFGLKPSFGQFLGIGTVPMKVTNSGGVPDLDVCLCFDVSGSIDDQTRVSFVKRDWTGDTATGNNRYTVATTRAGATAGTRANGRIYDILGPVPSGTRVNAMAPQYLALSTSNTRWPLTFTESGGSTRGLRGATETGSRPGNRGSTTITSGGVYHFTDLVVNIDGRNTFAGVTTPDGYAFPDIGTVVEAARGNLENNTVFVNSGASRSLPSTVAPRAGYRARYLQLAAEALSPLGEAQRAASDFFTIMNTNTRGHFSLICFSDTAGVTATTTYNESNVDDTYSPGGTSNFPIPNIALNNALGMTNYSTIMNSLPTTRATTATNIGDAVNRAVSQLRNNSRPGSKKAIVLFTDGMPTAPASDPEGTARSAARAARDAGIPIYSIGLAQNPEIIPDEVRTLTHTNSNPTTGGVSGIAGHGGVFFLVTNTGDLRKTFENIARQLVALVH